MKVFVAGATGAIGVPAVRALVAAGHDVTGTTRRNSKRSVIESLGARAVIVDALDAEAVSRAVDQTSPDAIVELLTALPKAPMRASDLDRTNTLRTTGTANVIAAGRASGTTKLIVESIAFFYGSGSQIFTEEDPLPEHGLSMLQPARDALREHERLAREAGGIVLRFGVFYGPETQSSRYIARMMRRRMMPLIDGGRGVLPWIHVDDAAAAVVAALDRGVPGESYNIVDDEPVSGRDALNAFADAARAPKPWSIPKWVARIAAPYPAEFFTWHVRISNGKAKRTLGWTLRYPTIREGIQTLAGI